ncbi:uncharacterized protein LOC106421428 [Brassica napus]|uniref:uncharacterized protein LOC106421428 n=1 Tax=Brassica napus TaxID=3708 RepID=UPI0006AB6196|nr:uncharacterized protein LOC106421428 [Brassica napus]
MGLPDLFIHWIRICISIASFSVSVNGSLEGFFSSARGSLWVSSVHHYLLRHSSFWDVRDDTMESWIWRKLLKMRTLAYQFIKVDIGNGKKSFFWHENWLRIGRLIDLTGATSTRYLGVTRNARVHDAVSSGQWSVRGQRSRNFKELHQMIQAEPIPSIELGEDTYLWKHEHGVYEEKFSAVRTWDLIRCKKNEVVWSRSV